MKNLWRECAILGPVAAENWRKCRMDGADRLIVASSHVAVFWAAYADMQLLKNMV